VQKKIERHVCVRACVRACLCACARADPDPGVRSSEMGYSAAILPFH
jgi:hypothetical protein